MCSAYHTTEPIYNLLQLINDQIMFIFREKAVENQWLQRNRPQIYSTMAHQHSQSGCFYIFLVFMINQNIKSLVPLILTLAHVQLGWDRQGFGN